MPLNTFCWRIMGKSVCSTLHCTDHWTQYIPPPPPPPLFRNKSCHFFLVIIFLPSRDRRTPGGCLPLLARPTVFILILLSETRWGGGGWRWCSMVVKSSQTSDGVKLTLFRQIPRQSARWLPARSVDTQNHPSFWFHFSRSQHHVGHVNNLCQSPCRRSSLLLLLRCSPLYAR